MARITRKTINDTFARVAEDYFRAANKPGVPESTKTYLTQRWAIMREVALAVTGRQDSLEGLRNDAAGWLKSCEQVAAEAAK